MKMLFCGPVLDFSGYANFSRNLARTLKHAGIDLVVRPLRYDQRDNNEQYEPEPWLKEMLQRPLKGIDIILQNTTPNVEAVPKPGLMNGLYFFWETDRLSPDKIQRVNEFDFLIVPCRFNAEMLVNSGCQRPILVFLPPCDASVYEKDYPVFNIDNAEGKTVFYNISQLSAKKGIDSLVRAYYAAFADMPDEALLVLKTYINMSNRQNEMNNIRKYIDRIKQGVRLPIKKYPAINVIPSILNDNEIHGLHKAGEVYVCSSRGEGFCIPAFDAVGHGNNLITNNKSGLEDWVRPEYAMVYNSLVTNVYDQPHPDPTMFTGVERWFEPSVAEMSHLMRIYHLLKRKSQEGADPEVTTKWQEIMSMRENGRNFVKDFDYTNVSSKIKLQLDAAYESWSLSGRVAFDANAPNAEVRTLGGNS